jgi:hypothetical protein
MKILLPLCVLLAGLTYGCQATHAIYVYDLSVGIDVAYSNEGTGKLQFGYDRDTYAIVPQRDNDELMSVTAVSKVQSSGLDSLDFNHFIATGAAAGKVARDPDGLAAIRAAIYGEKKQ